MAGSIEVGRGGGNDPVRREHLAATDLETVRPSQQDQRAVRIDQRHDQIEPPVFVQVRQLDEAGLPMNRTVEIEANAARVLKVKAVACTIEYQQIRAVNAAKNQIEVPVMIQVGANGSRMPGW